MDPLQHAPDEQHLPHLEEARRVLALPAGASGLHWHPFGVYAVPLARRTVDGCVWSRRLHLWHPEATPVGEASPYGVHTHSGTARSHVLAGTLQHHLYHFEPDGDGAWQRAALGVPEGPAALVAHAEAPTHAGVTHTLPAHQPHGVGKRPAVFAVSLFEQVDEAGGPPFTTWQRTDVPAEALVTRPPVDVGRVRVEALAVLERALFAAG